MPVDRHLFGSFLEHMGRAVYHGIYEPDSPLSDHDGFRTDVIALVKELGTSIVRYPGGNFVSGYRWEDGIGAKASRPIRFDEAWKSSESNQFGTDEFLAWCAKTGVEPMLAVNLGTRGPMDAAHLVEYCNGPADSPYGKLRAENGHPEPYRVTYWCLGNEMDGPWQIGHKTAHAYGLLARDAARAMRAVDSHIILIASGSSTFTMSTFGSWEKTVLAECSEVIDGISMHGYWGNFDGDEEAFLQSWREMDRFITRMEEILRDEGRGKKLFISFDEWNVNYHERMRSASAEAWKEWYHTSSCFEEFQRKFAPCISEARRELFGKSAPPLIEDTYTMEDAVVVGSLLCTLLSHAATVKIACIAQLVNVIAPIRTSFANAWRQTLYYPFSQASAFGDGDAYRLSFSNPAIVGVMMVCGSMHTLFLVNTSLKEDTELVVENALAVDHQLMCSDADATDTEAAPFAVVPRTVRDIRQEEGFTVPLPHLSWNVVRFTSRTSR